MAKIFDQAKIGVQKTIEPNSANKKALGEFNEDDAKVFLEDQKMLARIRLRSVAIITLQLAERIWNAIADVFKRAINTALNWEIL